MVGFRASGGRWASGFARLYAEGHVELKFFGIKICGFTTPASRGVAGLLAGRGWVGAASDFMFACL